MEKKAVINFENSQAIMKTTKLISIASMLKSTAVVVLMTLGGVSAMWGATATLKVWDLDAGAYVTWEQ